MPFYNGLLKQDFSSIYRENTIGGSYYRASIVFVFSLYGVYPNQCVSMP